MIRILKLSVLFVVGLACELALAQVGTEANEVTPEYLDATFNAADAARVAAGFSDTVIATESVSPLKRMTRAADLIVHASVTDQFYVYDAQDVPSTHTQITITQLLKGRHREEQITIIQLGGPSRTDSEKFLLVSSSRHFNVGEEELLFLNLDADNAVERNRVSVHSRFRVFENKLYDEDGYGIIVTGENQAAAKITRSRDRNPARRFKQINIGSKSIVKRFDQKNKVKPVPRTAVPTNPAAVDAELPGYWNSAHIDTLRALIAQSREDE